MQARKRACAGCAPASGAARSNRMARSVRVVGLSVFGMLVVPGAGCAPQPAEARTSDGVLVLELGGNHASLRGALEQLGVSLHPPQELLPPPQAAPPEPDDRRPDPGPQQDGTEQPPPAPPPVSPTPEFFVVKLGKNERVIHLARRHLGDGNRFGEILALNGWTETDARRLQEGTPVKIPKVPPKPRK